MRPKATLSRLTVLFVMLALPACVHQQTYVAAPAAVEAVAVEPAAAPAVATVLVAAGGPYAPALTGHDAPYQLDAGDRLRVQVFGQEGLTNSYIVDASGNISMTLIGTVPVRGLTTAEAGRAIAARLRNGYIRNPHVSVEVEVYRPFFILGEVNAPGQYPYVPNMTVEAAVAIAGGFAPRASKSDILLARNVNGEVMRTRVPADFPLRPGDTITVRERWF
ncbi:polysaccharide biosynthesis/export family protein [Pseudorhodoplanes sp.]|uniref:polysaccharide biosynthesis/export family protein n=1 Tax=Pseudorhodoplanes sp. TaxID=1934341 RepID=UPI003918A9DB